MRLSLTEHRELADYIARKVVEGFRYLGAADQKKCADIAWDAIEDYTASDYDNGPDILTAHKAATESTDNLEGAWL